MAHPPLRARRGNAYSLGDEGAVSWSGGPRNARRVLTGGRGAVGVGRSIRRDVDASRFRSARGDRPKRRPLRRWFVVLRLLDAWHLPVPDGIAAARSRRPSARGVGALQIPA